MSPWFFVKISRLVRNPPSRKMIILWAVVIGAALTLVGIEKFVGWPDWMTVNQWGGRFGGGGLR